MRPLLLLSRLLVGATFIISGLVKANDPLGFSYKLEEYFAESALNLPFLEPYALALAMLACVAEVVLGFAVLFGGRMKLATGALLALTLFFGWLTAYTATCDPQGTYTVVENGVEVEKTVTCVTDCGCFGDAMKGSLGRSLTPWESFSKDMVLLVFVLPIFLFRKRITWNTDADDKVLLPAAVALLAFYCWVFDWWFPLGLSIGVFAGYVLIKRVVKAPPAEWVTAGWVTAVAFAFTWYCLQHLPARDYRPFAVGKNIAEGMAMPEGAEPDVYETILRYRNKNTGEEKDFTKENYPWQDESWEWVKTTNKLIKAGYHPPIHDFTLTDADEVDVTSYILEEEQPVLLIVSRNVRTAATHCQPAINALAQAAYDKGWYVYGVTGSGYEAIEEFRHAHQNPFDYLRGDETNLKTMIRSNPGVVLLRKGTVVAQWHCNDVPGFAQAEALVK
ncbi:MAG: DoxX family protein [Flavobacteriales bacterium]|nr:DoxX family protein [Flavobacteriales bacterium]